MNKEYSKPATTVIEIAGIAHLAEGTKTPLGDGEVNPDDPNLSRSHRRSRYRNDWDEEEEEFK